ncbi:Kunitz/Bovine pancreatic trypsin inhibitor domain protein [Necator americanus]|uniref:Kunitz/Bovine pancreatic trypsin inhibitor domain protein n=1 Tax=Necator americanus TaxID=51031 RepID=W2T625_NECAM|nr:Kunitz/Bovine pancreatic trypsin inhibitor domain protein [Necator americanus]ETN77074.1 Kunitz/Bovine pancreatic trypsin inhibitor domain protein [Necator americanus]
MPFDAVLRLECIDASWVERFYWNVERTECEPFWYDGSCDPKDVVGKNFFESLESCRNACHEDVITTLQPSAPPREKSDATGFVTTPRKSLKKPDDLTAGISPPRKVFSPEDPFGLLAEQRIAATPRPTTKIRPPSHRQEVSNFAAKTKAEPFDRKKYMEEFKKKLTASKQASKQTSPSRDEMKDVRTHTTPDEPTTPQPQVQVSRKPQLLALDISGRFPEKFDRKKFMEEFKKQLTALPSGYVAKSRISTVKGNKSESAESSKRPLAQPPFAKGMEASGEPGTVLNYTSRSSTNLTTTTLPPSITSRKIGSEKFDRQKFVEEFKKRLTALPNGERSIIDFSKSYKLKRKPFTLPPSVFEEGTTSSSVEKKRKFPKSKEDDRTDEIPQFRLVTTGGLEKQTEAFEPQEKDAYTVIPEPMTTTDFVAETKKAVQETLEELSRPKDLCDEPLHPNLEEDCNNENWSCKKTCGHKYPVTAEDLKPHYYVAPTRDCAGDSWIVRAYFEPAKKGCKRIWWGGCVTKNQNLWMNVAECQSACAHKMEKSSTPSSTPSITQLRVVTPSTESSEIFNTSMSRLAADDPLAHSKPNLTLFTLVYPRASHFISPIRSSPKPIIKLRVRATLVTRRTTSRTTQNITANRTTTTSLKLRTSTQVPILLANNPSSYATNKYRPTVAQHQRRNTRNTTGDVVSRATTSVAKLRFQSDLDRQLAKAKRNMENREDLAYSSLVNHPVTIAFLLAYCRPRSGAKLTIP